MKNKLRIILLITLSVFLLASCAKNPDDNVNNSTTETKVTEKQDNKKDTSTNEEEKDDKEDEKIEKAEDTKEKDKEKDEKDDEKEDKDDKKEDKDKDKEKDDKIDNKALLEDIKLKNDKVRKVLMKSDLKDQKQDKVVTSKFVADVGYDDDKNVEKAKTTLETNEGYLQEITFDLSKSDIGTVLQKFAGEEETTVTEMQIETLDIHPDYHRLIEYITDLEDEFEITENSSSYTFKLDDDTEGISDFIISEYVENLSEVEDDSVKKSMKIKFDKETLLLENVDLKLEPTLEELKGFKISAKSKFSNHELAD